MKGQCDYPDYFARFYDTIYAKVRTIDHDFYLNQILNCKGKILEVGVGTGRLFFDALNEGSDIYGIDISQSMLNQLFLKTNPENHFRIGLQDICNITFKSKFDLIIAPFRVFSHLLETETQFKALDSVYKKLKPGGLFIFDLYVPDPLMIGKGLDQVVDFEGEYAPGKILKRTSSMKADIVNQISHVTMKFDWNDEDKQYSESWKMKMRFYFRYEIEHLINLSKFKLEKIAGNFDGKPIDTGDQEMIIFSRKR